MGRYIQADPLGLVDGASVYGYALQNPGRFVDFLGLSISTIMNPVHSVPDELGSICEGEDCHDVWAAEEAECYRKLKSFEIADIHGCKDRARYRFMQCLDGIPEEERVPKWTDADEDVPTEDNWWNNLPPAPIFPKLPKPMPPAGGGSPIPPFNGLPDLVSYP